MSVVLRDVHRIVFQINRNQMASKTVVDNYDNLENSPSVNEPRAVMQIMQFWRLSKGIGERGTTLTKVARAAKLLFAVSSR